MGYQSVGLSVTGELRDLANALLKFVNDENKRRENEQSYKRNGVWPPEPEPRSARYR